MKSWIFLGLLVLYLHGTSARLRSLMYFCTRSSGIPDFPEFVSVGLVDGVQIEYYDSNIRTVVPKRDWMNRVTESRADYWEMRTDIALRNQLQFEVEIGKLMQQFNQTGGVHIYQQIYGCEWDDETGEVSCYDQFGYDGEDFIFFDRKTETYFAAKPEAILTKQKWDKDKVLQAKRMWYLIQICPEWLKKFLDYGESSLMRTVLPSVSLLQKTSSSPVCCFATGFYPKTASLVWRRGEVEIHEDVEHREILPNQDGTFQMSVHLDLSSVKAEDWGAFDCVFQLSGVKEDMVTRLDRAGVKTNEKNPSYMTVIVVIAVVILLTIPGIFFLTKKKNDKYLLLDKP